MANSKYSQVTDLLAQGKLKWATDSIVGLLYTGSAFDTTHKVHTDLTGDRIATTPIQGRWVAADGAAMGLPALFSMVASGIDYQVVLAQSVGGGVLNVLAYFDQNEDASPINIQRTGSLIVRPQEDPAVTLPPDSPPTVGLWMRLGA